MLISTAQLQAHLGDPGWVVFDCRHDLGDHARGRAVYAEGHLPGAYFAAVETDLSGAKTGTNGRHPLPRAEDFAAFLSRHGVTPQTQVVAYDDAGGLYAARLWWLARWIGVTRVGVLDGGLPKWREENREMTTALPAPRAGGTVVARPDDRQWVGAAEVSRGISARRVRVVDARAAERFRGDVEPIDPVAGHIPTALNRFYRANLRPDQTMRPAEELRQDFTALLGRVDPAQVIHQCGSGVTACSNLLAMELAGLTGSKLYPGSWSEWVADATRPVARG
jgi:thiosulfate/3-mercaptopyruvate sulfurtransferase